MKRRIFFYDDNILRNHRDRYFKEIKGNRSIHAVVSTDGGCSVSTRQLSCYCDACLDCRYESCQNSAFVGEWEEQELACEDGHYPTVMTRSDISTTLEAIKNLATKHATVAIASADRGEDYYLLQVTGDGPEILSKEETDDWGATYPPDAEIIRRWFLTRNGNTRSSYQYKLIVDKKAVVYAATVMYFLREYE